MEQVKLAALWVVLQVAAPVVAWADAVVVQAAVAASAAWEDAAGAAAVVVEEVEEVGAVAVVQALRNVLEL